MDNTTSVAGDETGALLDARARRVRTLNTPWTLTPYDTLSSWEQRAQHIREHILASTGLSPMPEKTALRPRLFERRERDGYSVEKVYLESLPGFFVCGNLYRPLRDGESAAGATAPHPAIVSPHGHWPDGRLQNRDGNSVPGRCIELARRGFVTFSYDMAGYVDSDQIGHRSYGGPVEELWGIGVLGIQLWNSIRVIDFLQGLPDVDRRRIGCTGASGGGTQAFLLTAVDSRVAAAAPVNMVSAFMQGGCRCENQSHLRLDINNVEIAAVTAPRPLLLVACTGDWTVNTPEHEFPYIRSIYRLYGVENRVSWKRFEAEHNYNRDSREAMYSFFERWLLDSNGTGKERPFDVETDESLRVFSRRARPKTALAEAAVAGAHIRRCEKRLRLLMPRDRPSLSRFKRQMGPALQHAVAAEYPDVTELAIRDLGRWRTGDYLAERLVVGRRGAGDAVPAILVSALPLSRLSPLTVLVESAGKAAEWRGQRPPAMVRELLARGQRVLSLDLFGIGESDGDPAYGDAEEATFHTYNRSVAAHRIQDILTALAYARSRSDITACHLIAGTGVGVAALMARALARDVGRTCVALHGFGFDDNSWVKQCFVPAIRSAGDVRTAVALTAPGALMLHGAAKGFPTRWARLAYRHAGKPHALRLTSGQQNESSIVRWITEKRS